MSKCDEADVLFREYAKPVEPRDELADEFAHGGTVDLATAPEREIPPVRRLFLMMNTGTEAYLGITTGRITPGFVNTMWSPSVRT